MKLVRREKSHIGADEKGKEKRSGERVWETGEEKKLGAMVCLLASLPDRIQKAELTATLTQFWRVGEW